MAQLSRRNDGQTGSEQLAPEQQGTPDRSRAWRTAGSAAAVDRIVRRARINSPVLQGLIALLAYLAAWLPTGALQLMEHPQSAQLDQLSQDPNFYVWSLRWWPYAISHGLNPLFSAQIGVPVGHALTWVTTVPPLALLASPLTETAGPVVSFSLLTALAMPLSAWAAFVMCRRITRRFWAALVGGAVYGFSAYEVNHSGAGQLNLVYSLLLPLMVYLVLLWWEKRISSWLLVCLLAIAMALQFYLFLETFADMTGVWLLALVLAYLMAGRSRRRAIARLSGLVGVAYLVAVILTAPDLADVLTQVPANFRHAIGGEADLASLVVPRRGHTLGWGWLAHVATLPALPSEGCYIGIPLLLVVLVAAVFTWRTSRPTRFLTIIVLILIVASLGPALYVAGKEELAFPWAKVWDLPILRSAFPYRIMLFAYLALAVLAALLLADPTSRVWMGVRWALGLLVVAALVLDTPAEGVVHQSTVPSFISSGQYRRNLAAGENVVVVSGVGNAGMLWQAETGFYFRLAGGYINEAITPHTDLPAVVQALAHATVRRERHLIAFVKRARIGAILIDAKYEPLWVGVFNTMGLHGHKIGGVVVYPTHFCEACHVQRQRAAAS
jgi:hypothetical protein